MYLVYLLVKLKLSLRKFYRHHLDLVGHYGISMIDDTRSWIGVSASVLQSFVFCVMIFCYLAFLAHLTEVSSEISSSLGVCGPLTFQKIFSSKTGANWNQKTKHLMCAEMCRMLRSN